MVFAHLYFDFCNNWPRSRPIIRINGKYIIHTCHTSGSADDTGHWFNTVSDLVYASHIPAGTCDAFPAWELYEDSTSSGNDAQAMTLRDRLR